MRTSGPLAAGLRALVVPLAGWLALAGCALAEGPRTEDARVTDAAAPRTATGGASLPRPCTQPPDAELRVRLAGDVDRELAWRAPALDCEGMARPDGRGLRVTFAGELAGERLTFVFGIPRLAEGTSGTGVPVNVTVIRPGGRIYGTRGEDRCTLDEVRQAPLARDSDEAGPQAPATGAANAADPSAPRRWRIAARGFCLEPARAVADASSGAILLATFDFTGIVTWQDPPAPPSPAADPRVP